MAVSGRHPKHPQNTNDLSQGPFCVVKEKGEWLTWDW